jgi:epoxyqueuosine reductase
MIAASGQPDNQPLEARIKVEARRLGFSLVGITSPDPPLHYPVFENWLRAGRHGEMAYLASPRSLQRRGDPRQILPACQSILVLGAPYPASGAADPLIESAPSLRGQVASYAWGRDYHTVLPGRLRALVDFIEAQAGRPIPHYYCTDSAPILERDLAQRAGLGWIGKNTCLIHPRLGSYFLLAEVLLGLGLTPDPPFDSDQCGSCTRCLEACPTGCILPDRTLDASRCISYLTIELKGAIPTQLRPLVGEWVFGCDICQQVCPWNIRFAPPQGDPAFAPRRDVPRPALSAELSLTPGEFNGKFKDSPVRRAKRRGYLRNVAVTLANLVPAAGDPQAVEALAGALRHDPESLVRAHAAWALGAIGGSAAQRALLEARAIEHDAQVLDEIQAALVK